MWNPNLRSQLRRNERCQEQGIRVAWGLSGPDSPPVSGPHWPMSLVRDGRLLPSASTYYSSSWPHIQLLGRENLPPASGGSRKREGADVDSLHFQKAATGLLNKYPVDANTEPRVSKLILASVRWTAYENPALSVLRN